MPAPAFMKGKMSMRLLFEMDAKNYAPRGTVFSRPSARAIILRGGKVAMVHSLKYDYYKFPGGGIEPGEDHMAALVRETREEAGLSVIPASVRPYGYVHRVEKGDREDLFVQDNYYYFCDTEPETVSQALDAYEAEERFTLEFVPPETAIAVNRERPHGPKSQVMLEREARVLELLVKEEYLSADKFLCVLAGYDEETEARLAALQNQLYRQGFTGTQSKDIPLHITLGAFPPPEEEALKEAMSQAARACRPFEVDFEHIGVFGGSKVLFVAPDINRPLLRLKEHFGPSSRWTPHTTMLMDRPETVYRALPILAEGFQAFQGQVTSLHLYEFWPARHILSLPLSNNAS